MNSHSVKKRGRHNEEQTATNVEVTATRSLDPETEITEITVRVRPSKVLQK